MAPTVYAQDAAHVPGLESMYVAPTTLHPTNKEIADHEKVGDWELDDDEAMEQAASTKRFLCRKPPRFSGTRLGVFGTLFWLFRKLWC